MTIVFRLPAGGAERVGFAYSPALKREIEGFSYAVRSYFPEFLFPRPPGGLADFTSELAGLRTADPELRLEFAVPLLSPWPGGGEGRDPHALREPDVRALLRERVTRESDKAMAAMLLDDPRALLERWAAGVSEAGHQIEQRGLYGMLRGLWPEVRGDRQAERFWLERPHDHEVAIGPDDTLLLAPWPSESQFTQDFTTLTRVVLVVTFTVAITHPATHSAADGAAPRGSGCRNTSRARARRVGRNSLVAGARASPCQCAGPGQQKTRAERIRCPGLEPDGRSPLRRLGAAARTGAELVAAGVPAPGVPRAVRGLGAEGLRRGRLPAHGRGAPPGRSAVVRSGGRTLRQEPGVPSAVGRPRRQGEGQRRRADEASARRRSHPVLRDIPPGR